MTVTFLALAVLLQAPSGGEAPWPTFTSASGFSVAMPGTPVEKKQSVYCYATHYYLVPVLWDALHQKRHSRCLNLTLGAKTIAPALAEIIAALWLATAFKGGRHQDRLDQIAAIERGEVLELG